MLFRSDGAWNVTGCGMASYAEDICDYITGSSLLPTFLFEKKQKFNTGEEDLNVDVTKIVSATLANILPDSGYRISLSSQNEQDQYSYFVKRFASRTAYNSSKHPRLLVRYDDSIHDDTQNLRVDSSSTIFLRNYLDEELSNILSGSSLIEVSGDNCLTLELKLQRSDGSGSYSLYSTGSQYSNGLNFVDGTYCATFNVPSTDSIINYELLKSGSLQFTPIWSSLEIGRAHV